MSQHIRISLADGILELVMDRPDKKNALSEAMYGALADAIYAADTDPAVRVILLRAEGDSFTAGNDLAEFAAVAAGGGNPVQVLRFLNAIAGAAKPIVAAVQGRAVGVGTTMLLHCDYVVLADNALLSTPFVSLALVPEAASSLLLPQCIGHQRAFAMFALGETVAAEPACEWGLANQCVPLDRLESTALKIAQHLANRPSGAVMATKRLMRPVDAIKARMAAENAQFMAQLQSAEAREAFTAFAQKRAPDFRNC